MKKTVKKLLAVLLAVSFIFSMSTIAFAFDPIDFTGYEQYVSSFPDVAKNAWYYDAVTYCSACYITGYKNGNFGPADNLQRQDFAVMLLRFNWTDDWEGVSDEFANPEEFVSDWDVWGKSYPDVPSGQYYTGAVNYCTYFEIVNGYQNGKFGVGDKITREQVVTMLFRNAYENNEDAFWDEVGVDEEDREDFINYYLGDFPDANKVSSWARVAMLWAIGNEIITGKNGKIAPQDNITRAEVATILTRVDLDYLGYNVLAYLNGEYA